MTDLLSIGILPVLITLLAFRAGQFLQQKTKSPVCNPILIAVIPATIAVFWVSGKVTQWIAGRKKDA